MKTLTECHCGAVCVCGNALFSGRGLSARTHKTSPHKDRLERYYAMRAKSEVKERSRQVRHH